MHIQEHSEQHRLTSRHPGCKQKLFFYQREEYKNALPQCDLEKLYGVTTALEKAINNANKMWDKKM